MANDSDVQPMLWVDDIDATMAWYRDRLGFEIGTRHTDRAAGHAQLALVHFAHIDQAHTPALALRRLVHADFLDRRQVHSRRIAP